MIGLMVLAALAGQTATAPVSPEQADARCFAAFAMLADHAGAGANADAGLAEASKTGVIYFVGKLQGRNPGIDLEQVVRTALPAVQADAQGEIKRCSDELTAMGTALSKTGDALSKTP